MVNNLGLSLNLSAEDKASPVVEKLVDEIDRLTAELSSQQDAVASGAKDWLDYTQQLTNTANSMVGIVGGVEDVLIKTAEIGVAIAVYQKWKALVSGVESAYLTLRTAMDGAVVGGAALANAGFDSARVAADKLNVTIGNLVARFAGFAKIGEVLSLTGVALTIAQVGLSANESNEKIRLLTEQVYGLAGSLQNLDPQSKAVLVAKERFEALYKASLALNTSAESLLPTYKSFFDLTATGNLGVQKSADLLTDLVKTHQALRSSAEETKASQDGLNAAFESGFTSIGQLGQIFGSTLNPALDAVAKRMGVTREQLQSFISSGRLGSQDIIPALAAAANNLTKPLSSIGDAADFSKQQFAAMGLSFYDLSTKTLPGVDTALSHTAKEIAATADSAVDPIGAAVEQIVNFGTEIEDWGRRVKLTISEAFTSPDWSGAWSNGLKEAMYELDLILVGAKEAFRGTGEAIGVMAGAAVTATDPSDALSEVFNGMAGRITNTRDRLQEYINALEGVDNASGRTAEATKAAVEAMQKLQDAPIPEALQKIIDKLDSSVTAASAVKKVWAELGALDLTGSNLKNLTVLIQTMDAVRKATGDAVGTQVEFSKELSNLPTAALVELLDKVTQLRTLLKNSGNDGVLMGTVLGAVFDKLGLDTASAGNKVTQYGKDATAAFVAIAKSAETNGLQVRAAFEAALNAAKTQADVELMRAAFDQLAGSGSLSQQLIADGAAAVFRRLAELKDAIPGVAEGFKALGVESAAHLQDLADSLQASFNQIKISGAGLNQIQDAFLKWAEAAVKAATASDSVIPATLRNQAAALGLSAALQGLIEKHKRLNLEQEALIKSSQAASNEQGKYTQSFIQLQNAQKNGLQAEIDLAKARGDGLTVIQKSIELARMEAEQAKNLADVKVRELQIQEKAVVARIAELNAIKDKTEAQQIELQGLNLKITALKEEEKLAGVQAEVAAATAELTAKTKAFIVAGYDEIEAKKLALLASGQFTEALKLEEEQRKKTTEATEKQKDADAGVTDALRAAVTAAEQAADAEKAAADQTQVAGSAASGALQGWSDRLGALSDKARQAFDGYDESAQGAADSSQELADAVAGLAAGGYVRWANEAAIRALEIEQRFNGQAESAKRLTEQLQDMADGGRVNMAVLAKATRGVSGEFDLLDQQRLDTLQSAIDAVNDKLRKTQEDAANARLELLKMQADTAAAEGDQTKADLLNQQYTYQQKLSDIEEKRRQAELDGNRELVAIYEAQVRELEKTNNLKVKSIKNDAKSSSDSTSSTSSSSSGSASKSATGGASGGISSGGSSGVTATFNIYGNVLDNNFLENLSRQIEPKLTSLARRRA